MYSEVFHAIKARVGLGLMTSLVLILLAINILSVNLSTFVLPDQVSLMQSGL